MNSILRNVYIDRLDIKVNKFNDTYHRTIKMKPIDVHMSTQASTYTGFLMVKIMIKFINLKLAAT